MNPKILDVLYGIHDHYEEALREFERIADGKYGLPMPLYLREISANLWRSHDSLERAIIEAQSHLTEEELDKHE